MHALRLTAACACVQLVTCVGEAHGGASYCVNMKRIIDLIRMKEVRTQLCCCFRELFVGADAT